MSTQSVSRKREPHPLYLTAPAAHRWAAGSLPALFLTLRRVALAQEWDRAASAADKDFSWFVLPGGAVVGLRKRGDLEDRMELRIARKELPETAAGKEKFEAEVETFLRHFEIVAGDGLTPSQIAGRVWQRLPIVKAGDQGKAVARFIELRHGECAPGRALCYLCLRDGEKTVVSWWPAGGFNGQRCDDHVGKEPAE